MAARKGRKPSDVVGRVASALLDCPLTPDEIRTLERIETRRQEADSDMRHALTPEQKTKAYAKAARAGEEAIALMRRVSERKEASWSASALRELDALAMLRGDEVEETSSGARRKDPPLTRLHRAKLITDEEAAAGYRYGLTWQRLYAGSGGEGSGDLDPMDSRVVYLKRLDEARGYSIPEVGGRAVVASGLGGDARLVKICDDVCGREMSLREYVLGNASGSVAVSKREGETDEQAKRRVSGHQRAVAMERLRRALGLLALHYGLLRTREDELEAA